MGVSRYLICSEIGHAEGLLAATLFFDVSEESQLKALKLMTRSYIVCMFTMINFAGMIDIFLQIDLVLTLKRPFLQTGPRQIFFIAISLIISLISGGIILITDGDLASPVN